ncbi:MAG: hypothetical protein KF795_14630 [Labilithrix sp.]|nr:hypothetical protein [Labilithrix sp.]
MSARLAAVALLALGVGAAGLACESAVNLDVTYTDAGAPDGAVESASPAADGGEAVLPPLAGSELESCPCDSSQGLACCVSAAGPAFCTTDEDRCRSERGALYRCFGPDPNTESVCCWRGSGEGATTALAAECSTGPRACAEDAHCETGETCRLVDCHGVRIGACGTPPVCPP